MIAFLNWDQNRERPNCQKRNKEEFQENISESGGRLVDNECGMDGERKWKLFIKDKEVKRDNPEAKLCEQYVICFFEHLESSSILKNS